MSPSALVLSTLLGILGCGKEKVLPDKVDLKPVQPVYAILPDTAPLRDQLEEAAGFIERDLLEEQEKFFLKRLDDIRRFYTDPKGKRLVSRESWREMLDLMKTRFPVRLKITCRRLELLVPVIQGVSPEAPVGTTLHFMGTRIRGTAGYSDTVSVHTIRIEALYEYKVQAGSLGNERRTDSLIRYILYTKTPSGRWIRTRIIEKPVDANQ